MILQSILDKYSLGEITIAHCIASLTLLAIAIRLDKSRHETLRRLMGLVAAILLLSGLVLIGLNLARA